jgi:hypothetical protein
MSKKYNPYIKQAIELTEDSKKTVTVSRELIESTTDDRLLGMYVRGMLITKLKQCDEYIDHMKKLEQ